MNEVTFGGYVRQKRLEKEMSMRGLAQKLGLSPVYMSNIENDLRPAPSLEKLEMLARILLLDKPEKELMLDLAAKSKKSRCLPIYQST